MKQIIIVLMAIAGFSCSSNDTGTSTNAENVIVARFLTDISSLVDNSEKGKNPIPTFIEEAKQTSDNWHLLTKENINDLLVKAKKYSHCVITTGDHTIVKITALENCQQSASWGACIPFAEGYVKKDNLVHQANYMNYIIGKPDAQERIIFLFK
jgi:hypothetical protein